MRNDQDGSRRPGLFAFEVLRGGLVEADKAAFDGG
jgi:hypothetical protein